MRNVISFLVLIILITLFFKSGYLLTETYYNKQTENGVLSINIEANQEVTPSQTITLFPSSTPTPSPTPTTFPSPTPKPSIIPTSTPFPITQPKLPPELIHAYMERFAGQYGIDVNILRHIAVCESGFNPMAVNGPYAGLFQFNSTTWKNNRILIGEDTNPDLRFNAEEAIQTAAYLLSQGKFHLWPNCKP